jgi:energy-coupling factor transport system permease protein
MYVAAETIIHRLDPRIKMGAALLFMVAPFVAPGWQSALVLVATAICIAFLAAVPFISLVHTVRTVFWLGFLMFFFYAFTTPGQPVLAGKWIVVTWEGVIAGAIQIYRLCLLVVVSSLLTYTTSPSQLAHGLEAFLRPLTRIGLPVREAAMVLTIALRFVPTMAHQIETLAKAQRARGMDYGPAPWDRVRTWIPMFVPLFVAAFRRAERLATAMEARGFRGTAHRTRMTQLRLQSADLGAVLVVAAIALAVLSTTLLY